MQKYISYFLVICFVIASNMFSEREVRADTVIDSTAHACNACSDSQMKNMAESYGAGKHYIYNLSGNIIRLINVTSCEPGFNGTITCIDLEPTVPAGVSSAFSSYHSAWLGNSQSEAFTEDVNYTMPSGNPLGSNHQPLDNGDVNAFDTHSGSSYQNSLIQWLGDASHYSGFMSELISALNNLPTTDFSGLMVTITVHFSDGSKRTYTYTPGVKAFRPVRDTAIDAHNNTLPEAPPQTSQFYFFGGLQNYAPYDQTNVIELLPAPPPSLPSEGCAEEKWDGHAVTCIQPK